MRYVRYGIVMERLTEEHLELVRRWRNRDFIRSRMQFREEIHPGAQRQWFQRLHPEKDWYFVACLEGEPFGLFNVKHIDWEGKSGETGAFVANPAAIGGLLPGLAVLALMDFAFLLLELDQLVVTYNPSYNAVERLNLQLGYEVFTRQENGFVKARITKERFRRQSLPFRLAAEKLRGQHTAIIDPDPFTAAKIRQSDLAHRFNWITPRTSKP